MESELDTAVHLIKAYLYKYWIDVVEVETDQKEKKAKKEKLILLNSYLTEFQLELVIKKIQL